MLEKVLFFASALLVLSVFVSTTGSRFGVPSLTLFLLIGLVAGSEPREELELLDFATVRGLGVIALIFILFAGGLSTKLDVLRLAIKPSLALSTVGVLIAALLTGAFARYSSIPFNFTEGALLGAVVAATDVAAVFSVLRLQNLNLNPVTAGVLELESALNDPMVVFLTVSFLGMLTQSIATPSALVFSFFWQMGLGGIFGYLWGRVSVWVTNFLTLPLPGLYPPLMVGLMVLCFTTSQQFGASGYLAVYVAGVVVGNHRVAHQESLLSFFEAMSWLMQIAMFLCMGLLIDHKELIRVAPLGIAIAVFLLFVARPVSVFATLAFSRINWREKLIISWGGLRGAVPIILAMFVLEANVEKSDLIFHLAFFLTFISVIIQGITLPWVARRMQSRQFLEVLSG